MLIVAVGLLASGKISTRSPLERSYSVIPSTLAPFVTPCGSCAASGAAASTIIAASLRPVRVKAVLVIGPLLWKKRRVIIKAGSCSRATQVLGVSLTPLIADLRGTVTANFADTTNTWRNYYKAAVEV